MKTKKPEGDKPAKPVNVQKMPEHELRIQEHEARIKAEMQALGKINGFNVNRQPLMPVKALKKIK